MSCSLCLFAIVWVTLVTFSLRSYSLVIRRLLGLFIFMPVFLLPFCLPVFPSLICGFLFLFFLCYLSSNRSHLLFLMIRAFVCMFCLLYCCCCFCAVVFVCLFGVFCFVLRGGVRVIDIYAYRAWLLLAKNPKKPL